MFPRITGKGVYKDTIVLNSISKKGLHVLLHIVVQLRLNDAWVTRILDLFPIAMFPIGEEDCKENWVFRNEKFSSKLKSKKSYKNVPHEWGNK